MKSLPEFTKGFVVGVILGLVYCIVCWTIVAFTW